MISAPAQLRTAISTLYSMPRVCVAITGTDANDMIEKAESLARDNSFIEFRLDYVSQPVAGDARKSRNSSRCTQHVVAIATCRRAENGGKFKGSLAAQLDILGKAAGAGCQII